MNDSKKAIAKGTRRGNIREALVEIFRDLSGIELEAAHASKSFLEMGFDSLFLTQVTQAIKSKYEVKVTFRQLLGDLSTLEGLTQFLDEKLPAGHFLQESSKSEAQPALPVVTSVAPDPAILPISHGSAPLLERVLRDQLNAMNQLFTQQLAAVRGSGTPREVKSVVAMAIADLSPRTEDTLRLTAKTEEDKTGVEELKAYTPFKPLQAKTSEELTPDKKKYIDDLIARYSRRTPKSKAMTQAHRQVLADPRVVAGFKQQWKEMVYPIITDRSKGSRLWDIDGNEYIDFLNGFGPIMLGHRPGFVEHAVEQQLHQGFEIGPQTPLAGEVAELLCEMTGTERATFCNTGSEAVTAAIRVARTVTGRNKVVIFAGDYHGMFDEVLVKGIKKDGLPATVPSAPGIPRENVLKMVVLEYGATESLEWIRKNVGDLAAVIVEPVQSRHPDLQPVAFLKELRKITEASDVCFVFDEVVTGFRVHPGGCQALFDIRADLVTYGKVLAGGMPIGVLAGKRKFMDAFDGGMWQFGDDSFPEVGVTFLAGTFVRHPLAMAACKAVLEYLKQQGPELQSRLNDRSADLAKRLNSVLEKYVVPTRVENFSSIFYFSFLPEFRFGSLFYASLREKGIHLLEGFPCFLTTEHSDSDIEKIVRAFEETSREMQVAGLLPQSSVQRIAEPIAQAVTLVPVTESQREIWLAASLGDVASCAFNESFTLRLRGSLNEELFLSSLQKLFVRHESLRASFSEDGTTLKFAPATDFSIPLIDLSGLEPAARDSRLAQEAQKEARTPFDLSHGPLVRVKLFRLEPRLRVLFFTSHHIVCDGWSTNVLLDELGKLYSSHTVELPPAVRFSDYAIAQASKVGTPEREEAERYWLSQFEKPAPVLELPTDQPRAAVKSFSGDTFRHHIGKEHYTAIKNGGASHGCTLFVTLLAGFYGLLQRLTLQDDFVVGIPTAGQSLLENGSLVGDCVNFLPLRCQINKKETALELLESVKKSLLDAYEHQDYTYGILLRKLALVRDPSRLPLVEVQFNVERVATNLHFSELEAEVDPNSKVAANFDLFLNIIESETGLSIDCDYNTQLFARETIGRWLSHFETLLLGFAAASEQPVARLPILTEKERHRLLTDWNNTEAGFPPDRSVDELIEARGRKTPNFTVVADESRSLKYVELDCRSNQLANYLVKQGVRPGHLVGVAMDRSVDMVVALLGIWKAGAAYVPLDPFYPAERLRYILGETSVPLLLTQTPFVGNLPVAQTKIVCLDRDWILIESESETRPCVPKDADRNAYVIFTSGSTGRPKGVEVTHRNLVNFLGSMQHKPGLLASDRLLAVTTLSFDIAGLELFLPLITGAQVVLASRETASDGRLLLRRIEEQGITVMQATPATWRLLLEAGWKGIKKLKILCGGEAVPRDLANQLAAYASSVWNMYGPTETTIWSAVSEIHPGDGPVLIGLPIDNTQFYVLDEWLEPVPVGVPGELHIGGDGVARGYLNRPDLTAERFIPNPFRPGTKLYRTGDLVRYTPEQNLEFLGRLDNQVKIRGFRIELGDVEAVLARHPTLRGVVVNAQDDASGSKKLVGYLVCDASGAPDPAELRSWAGRFLPEYMIPSLFVFLSEFPRTPNGKIDQKALPKPDSSNLLRRTDYLAPRTQKETQLEEICKEVLRAKQVSITDSLFDLGADSIHLFQIIARAARYGLAIKPEQLLRLRTIAALGAELDQMSQNAQAKGPILAEIAPVSRQKYRVDLAHKV